MPAAAADLLSRSELHVLFNDSPQLSPPPAPLSRPASRSHSAMAGRCSSTSLVPARRRLAASGHVILNALTRLLEAVASSTRLLPLELHALPLLGSDPPTSSPPPSTADHNMALTLTTMMCVLSSAAVAAASSCLLTDPVVNLFDASLSSVRGAAHAAAATAAVALFAHTLASGPRSVPRLRPRRRPSPTASPPAVSHAHARSARFASPFAVTSASSSQPRRQSPTSTPASPSPALPRTPQPPRQQAPTSTCAPATHASSDSASSLLAPPPATDATAASAPSSIAANLLPAFNSVASPADIGPPFTRPDAPLRGNDASPAVDPSLSRLSGSSSASTTRAPPLASDLAHSIRATRSAFTSQYATVQHHITSHHSFSNSHILRR